MRVRLGRAGRCALPGDAALSAAPSWLARRRRGLANASSCGAFARQAGPFGRAAQHDCHALPPLPGVRDCARSPAGSVCAPVRGGVLGRGGGVHVLSCSGPSRPWCIFTKSSVDSRVNVSTAPGSFAGVVGGEMLWAGSCVLGSAAASISPLSDGPRCNSQSTLREKTVLW